MLKRKNNDKIDYKEINESISLLNKILKILFFVLIIIGIFVTNYILKEWKILHFIKIILGILTPFFIGFFIAWLFNPLVVKLSKKMKRSYATIIVYFGFLIVLTLFLLYCVPTMVSQLNDFTKVIPKIQNTANNVIDSFYNFASEYIDFDVSTLKKNIYSMLINFGSDITNDLPTTIISVATKIVSGLGTFLIGLVIGLYMLFDFDGMSKHVLSFFPKHMSESIQDLFKIADKTLVKFIQGTFMISLILSLFTYIAFLLIGVKAPLLFAIFVGITNIIPYIGPYIGGIPVVLVGFSQSTTSGILVIIAVIAAQTLDEYVLRPLLLGRGLNLHPVTIIIALLIFGHFFGIVGMLLAMPVVATIKVIYNYYDEKYDFFNRREIIDEDSST